MGQSNLAGTSLDNRIVRYAIPGGSYIQLNYTNTTSSIRFEYIGRQQVKRIYRLSFQFLIAGDTKEKLTIALNNAERTLATKGGTLEVYETGESNYLYRSEPAGNVTPTVLVSHATQSTNDRINILYDIDWGPKPVSFNTIGQLTPLSVLATWTVDITTAPEEAIAFQDSLVLGVDAEVTYEIDQNHYTTRKVTGRVHCMNFGRYSTGFQRSVLSQADNPSIREAIISNAVGQNSFMDPILIPPNFIRIGQNWTVDSTENVMYFTIVDREVYRLYPAYITHAQAKLTTSAKGISSVQFFQHSLSGSLKAPRDISKLVVVQGFYEIVQDVFSFLTRETAGRKGFIYKWQITNDLYDNAISFNILAYSPMDSGGQIDLIPRLGIGNFSSSVFFPPGPGGSANLTGSAYRQEQGRRTNFTLGTGAIGSSNTSGVADFPDMNSSQVNSGKYNLANQLYVDIGVISQFNKKLYEAGTSDKSIESEVFSTESTELKFIIKISSTRIFNRKNATSEEGIIAAVILELLAVGSGLEVGRTFTENKGSRRSVLGTGDLVREYAEIECFITGERKANIEKKGGLSAFISWLQKALNNPDISKLDKAIRDYFKV